MNDTDALRRWALIKAPPAILAQWQRAVGVTGVHDAEVFIPLGITPQQSAPFRGAGFPAEDAAYLIQHEVTAPSPDEAVERWVDALTQRTLPERYRNPEFRLRTNLTLAHPTLTSPDHDAIVTAHLLGGVPMTEIDAYIASGTFDRDALTVLGALS